LLLGRIRLAFPFHTSPKRIALGISIGLFVAFLPAIGFQMGMALVVAWVLNASRPAAMACVWVTNPWTMGPVYAIAYLVGRPFWFASHDVGLMQLSEAIHGGHSPYGVGAVFIAFQNMYTLGADLFMPMLIGGAILGAIVGFIGYYPTLSVASHIQSARRRGTRRSRRGTVHISTRSATGTRVSSTRQATYAHDRQSVRKAA
jgi:uncharacterized protein